MSGSHLGFVIAAYGVAAATIAVMIAAVLLDRRALQRALDRLARRAPEQTQASTHEAAP